MKLIIRLLLNAVAVIFLAQVLNGVNVDTYLTAVIVAVVLSILKFIGKTYSSYFNPTNYYYYFRSISVSNQCFDYTFSR